jgi:NAD(P)-dependent dehydrogenase (short-subunit alcohol dehydrogenase family)
MSPSLASHTVPTARRPVALVTGAARRIGRTIALELAAHGFDLAVHCRASLAEARDTAKEARALGAEAEVFEADLSLDGPCQTLVGQVVARFGRLDALVNNASLFEYDDALSAAPAGLGRHWLANVVAPVTLAQALARHLSARAAAGEAVQGCVVNLLDQKLWNPNPDYFSYTLTKAALREATVLLAQALAPQVRVVGVAPGVTLVSGPMTDDEYTRAHALTPLKRSSTPQDIARTVRFVLESPAITGTTLLVDGGQHLAAQSRDVLFLAQHPG